MWLNFQISGTSHASLNINDINAEIEIEDVNIEIEDVNIEIEIPDKIEEEDTREREHNDHNYAISELIPLI